MRNAPKFAALATLVLVSFCAGVVTGAIFHPGLPIVSVRLQNAANQAIASVQLEHEHGSLTVASIAPGDSRKVYFHAPGESSYRIRVVFADGHPVAGGAGYVEPGYSVTETISETEIKSDYR